MKINTWYIIEGEYGEIYYQYFFSLKNIVKYLSIHEEFFIVNLFVENKEDFYEDFNEKEYKKIQLNNSLKKEFIKGVFENEN